MVNYWMLGLNAEPAVVCRGLTSAGLQSGSKEIACLMFFSFFCLFARERQIARRIAAKEIAVSRGARGTANGREEKAKNSTADERRYTQMDSQVRTHAMILSKFICVHPWLFSFIRVNSRPFVVNLWILSSVFEAGGISATLVVANTMRTSRSSSLPMRSLEAFRHFATRNDRSI
jgi:hypothetical protein